MSALGVWKRSVDIIGKLPVEIAEMILQKLDPLSLMNAAKVSPKWMSVCKGFSRLRKSARQYLRRQKRCILELDVLKSNRPGKPTTSRSTRIKTCSFQRFFLRGIPQSFLNRPSNIITVQRGILDRSFDISKRTLPTRSQLRLRWNTCRQLSYVTNTMRSSKLTRHGVLRQPIF